MAADEPPAAAQHDHLAFGADRQVLMGEPEPASARTPGDRDAAQPGPTGGAVRRISAAGARRLLKIMLDTMHGGLPFAILRSDDREEVAHPPIGGQIVPQPATAVGSSRAGAGDA
jgi:hypothetical protein